MKSLVVVLAFGLVAATPEADPALLYANAFGPYNAAPYYNGLGYAAGLNAPFPYAAGYAPYAAGYAPYAAGYAPYAAPVAAAVAPAVAPVAVKTVSSPLASVRTVTAAAPVAAPLAATPLLARAVAPVVAPIAAGRVLTPRDCVTQGGCAVRSLLEAGLARKKRESDPQLLTNAAFAPAAVSPLAYAGLNGLNAYAPYSALYNGEYAAAGLYNNFNGLYNNYNAAYAPYAGLYNPYAYAPNAAVAVAAPAPVAAVAAPVAPVVVKAAPAPVVVKAVRAPVAVPVVEEYTRPVTYTHLGAHPISPTTVVESDSRVVGHQLI